MIKILILFVCLIGLIVLYLVFWPVPIDPAAWTPPALTDLTGVYKPNSSLTQIKRIGEGIGIGPEAVAFDGRGRIYTGVNDGRILRFEHDGTQPQEFCHTNGRPFGLKFDSAGNLIVADGLKGLLMVTPAGEVSVLTNSVNGTPINLANDLDIAADGTIYFTDSSRKFSYNKAMLDFYEHRPNGSLLAYNPKTEKTTLLLADLYFPNGVAINLDQSFVLVCETWRYRIIRYWLSGPQKGKADIFLDNLPGFPDNITFNGRQTYWIALVQGPESRRRIDWLLPKPFLRKVLLRIPRSLRPSFSPIGYVLGMNLNGEIVMDLRDPTGTSFAQITSVIEHDNTLYFGSISENAIGYFSLLDYSPTYSH